MQKLIAKIKELKKSSTSRKIDMRLKQFTNFKSKGAKDWFSELCFCILTANSKAITAIHIQKELGCDGFISAHPDLIRDCIIRNKHRFHNNKAKFIVNARMHLDIKDKINKLVKERSQIDARDWLVQNIKGLGYKEASHYLRNTGHFNLAVLDRHVLNLMVENDLLAEKPKSLNRFRYIEYEKKLEILANKLVMSQAELDLYLWYMKTGEVLK